MGVWMAILRDLIGASAADFIYGLIVGVFLFIITKTSWFFGMAALAPIVSRQVKKLKHLSLFTRLSITCAVIFVMYVAFFASIRAYYASRHIMPQSEQEIGTASPKDLNSEFTGSLSVSQYIKRNESTVVRLVITEIPRSGAKVVGDEVNGISAGPGG